jgi:hypothetical protein
MLVHRIVPSRLCQHRTPATATPATKQHLIRVAIEPDRARGHPVDEISFLEAGNAELEQARRSMRGWLG